MGAEGLGRNAGQPGTRLEGAMSSGMIPAQPEKILAGAGEVWTSLGKEERQQGKPTVLRACAMTLIVITDEEDQDSIPAIQTLVELMHAHPSRAIVLRSDSRLKTGSRPRLCSVLETVRQGTANLL